MMRTALLLATLLAAAPAGAQVTVASTADASRATSAERADNTAALRRALDRIVASSSGTARVDATLESVVVESRGELLVVSARVRCIVSDDTGRILSMLSGSAKVEQRTRDHARNVRAARADAVIAAVDSLGPKLRTTVATRPTKVVAMSPGVGRLSGGR